MNDDNGRPSRIIPIRDRQDPAGKRMSSAEIKQEIIAGVAAGSLAVGQKLYMQVVEETARLLGEMEHRLTQDYDAKFALARAEWIAEMEKVHGPIGGMWGLSEMSFPNNHQQPFGVSHQEMLLNAEAALNNEGKGPE